ncbi:unnamed protein product [Orchesella dallaii]|uniref:Uncharacterized protein n=1 Tax=Orchesella dallaii TaxID=48710 RepID=A0ABP1S729_9HEXA
MSIVLHYAMSCVAILFLFYSIWVTSQDEIGNERKAGGVNGTSTGSNLISPWPLVPNTPIMDTLSGDQKQFVAAGYTMFTVLAPFIFLAQFYSASLLLEGTEKNVMPNEALKKIQTHQHIQLGFLFAEMFIIMLSTSGCISTFGTFLEIVGWNNLPISALFRIASIFVVNLFAKELKATIGIDRIGKETTLTLLLPPSQVF